MLLVDYYARSVHVPASLAVRILHARTVPTLFVLRVNNCSSTRSPTPHSILLNSRHQSITLLFYTEQLTVWVGNNTFTGEEMFANVTTWVSVLIFWMGA